MGAPFQHPDPRLLDLVGPVFAREHGVLPLCRVGALTLVAARDMQARIETIGYLEVALGPVSFVDLDDVSVNFGPGRFRPRPRPQPALRPA